MRASPDLEWPVGTVEADEFTGRSIDAIGDARIEAPRSSGYGRFKRRALGGRGGGWNAGFGTPLPPRDSACKPPVRKEEMIG